MKWGITFVEYKHYRMVAHNHLLASDYRSYD